MEINVLIDEECEGELESGLPIDPSAAHDGLPEGAHALHIEAALPGVEGVLSTEATRFSLSCEGETPPSIVDEESVGGGGVDTVGDAAIRDHSSFVNEPNERENDRRSCSVSAVGSRPSNGVAGEPTTAPLRAPEQLAPDPQGVLEQAVHLAPGRFDDELVGQGRGHVVNCVEQDGFLGHCDSFLDRCL